jgi:protein SCO1/2|tara:strand:+ start:7818 stop:8408 length:591 start_codon:yes stop_codon:yes gene_type:complete
LSKFREFFLALVCSSGITSAGIAQQPVEMNHDMHNLSMPTFSAGIAEMSLEFELVGAEDQLVSQDDFAGKNMMLAFGFTHCIHICPLIAANMANTLKIADSNAVGVFVSVDTERDTPEITNNYSTRFHPKITGLSGSHDQVSQAAKSFNTTFVVTKTPDSYTVQHSPGIFLISPEGELIDVFAINTAPQEIAAAMK